jgi:hypothetical protein
MSVRFPPWLARFDFAFTPDNDFQRDKDSFVSPFSIGTAFYSRLSANLIIPTGAAKILKFYNFYGNYIDSTTNRS